LRIALAKRRDVEPLDRVATALECRACFGGIRVAVWSEPQNAARMPQAEAGAVPGVELAPLLA